MNIFLLFAFSTSRISLPLDDSWHNQVLDAENEFAEFIVQGRGKKAKVLVVMDNESNFDISRQNYGAKDFTKCDKKDARGDNHFTMTIPHEINDYFYLKVKCHTLPCEFTIRNVHTSPVYRVSAVLGSFSLFISLFLTVFAWTIFCGACRAERKR